MSLRRSQTLNLSGLHRQLQIISPAFFMLILFVVVSACQSQEVVAVANVGQGSTAVTPTVTQTNTPLPAAPNLIAPVVQPILVSSATAVAPDMPSFALADPAELTRAAEATATSAAVNVDVPLETAVSATETATNTPMPTFTPPALPQTLPDEHYWFKRPVAEDGIVWTNKHYPYGSTRGGELRPHHGVEFDVPYNTEILAVASGTVVVAGADSATAYGPQPNFYGNLVIIEHDTNYKGQKVYTLYGHLNNPLVAVGDHVAVADVIGLSGATGVADGPHMHFEVRLGQNSYEATQNPLLWLWPFPDRGTIAGRVTFANGSVAYEAPIRAVRVDANSRYAATSSYAQDGFNADDIWQENFAIDDVEAGFYEIIVYVGEEKYETEVWVYPRRTSFVEIELP